MTRPEWFAYARTHATVLRSFISRYHPNAGNGRPYKGQPYLPITAPTVERLRSGYDAHTGVQHDESRSIVAHVKAESPADPLTQFDQALQAEDVSKIYSVLDSAWFGVPESTTCWKIEGFPEAVELMDTIPEPTVEEMEMLNKEEV